MAVRKALVVLSNASSGELPTGDVLDLGSRTYVRAYASAGQATSASMALVAFGGVSDGSDVFANNTLTVPAGGAGIWAIDVGVVITGLAANEYVNCSLYINGAERAKVGEQNAVAGTLALTAGFHLRLAVGDLVTVQMRTGTAGRTIYGDVNNQVTTFTAYKL
ncbi:hypothetical protein DAETH_29140 [Deinococcus aetherius]|uniref:Uncharacterized protein n=1 Tax=Deinococcus aetherius TaxID=200252 RepID=A0ABN6RJG2_9DEIO|nr:hypothetical protein [Deinococcus aetherius]BDP42945.1 hypothetical protein DAETH_29140 [Deinococcus aetherius]